LKTQTKKFSYGRAWRKAELLLLRNRLEQII
jgi:hypothetical protein